MAIATFQEFVDALMLGGWSYEEITGDVQQPQELVDLIESVGINQAEEWIIHAIAEGILSEQGFSQNQEERDVSEVLGDKTLSFDNHRESAVVVEGNSTTITMDKCSVENLQEKINNLVNEYGDNLPFRSDVEKILCGTGVEPSDLTPEAIAIAVEFVEREMQEKTKAQAKPSNTRTLLRDLPPGSKFKLPECSVRGTYDDVVCTLVDVNDSDAKVRIKENGKSTEVRWSSGTEVVYLGGGDNEENLVQEENPMTAVAEDVFEVPCEAARSMLIEMGLKAEDFSPEDVAKRLRRFDKLAGNLEEPTSKESRRLAKEVLDVLQEGLQKIVVVSDDTDTDLADEDNSMVVIEEEVVHAPKRRGRPPKVRDESEEVESTPKRRGRPPKIQVESNGVHVPKRRGRPPKIQEDEPEQSPKRRGRPPKVRDESEEVESTPKRRGRPPKIRSSDEEIVTPKRRGRPPKERTEEDKHTPKRRGRPPKIQEDDDNDYEDESVGVDKFGSRNGSNFAKINNALSARVPKSMKELIEDSGIDLTYSKPNNPQLGVYYTHLRKLVDAGHVVKTDDGYILNR